LLSAKTCPKFHTKYNILNRENGVLRIRVDRAASTKTYLSTKGAKYIYSCHTSIIV